MKKIIVLVLLVIAIVFFLASGGDNDNTISPQSFNELLESDKVTNVVYDKFLSKVTFQLIEDSGDKTYESYILDESVLARHDFTMIEPNKPLTKGEEIALKVLWTVLFVILLVVLFAFFGSVIREALSSVDKHPYRLVKPEDNKVGLNDVISNNGQHDEVLSVIEMIKNNAAYELVGAEVPRGILMEGPPGTGKTLVAQAIASSAGVNFIEISGSEFIEKYVGTGAKRVRDLFKFAKKHAPAIIFIDEIDSVGRKRDGENASSNEASQTINQLLTEMQGFGTDSKVIVLAATNMAEVLDPALIRPGRFDRIVSMSLPDMNSRIKLAELYMKKYSLVFAGSSVEPSDIARITTGFSPAEIKNLLNEVAVNFANDTVNATHAPRLTMSYIENARDKIVMGPESKKVMSEDELWMTAYHEAGHAITGYLSPEHNPVRKVTIVPRGNALGVTMFTPDEDRYSYSKISYNSRLVTLYGGRAAEEIIYGPEKVSSGAKSDIDYATRIAKSMVFEYGYNSLASINFTDLGQISPDTLQKLNEEFIETSRSAYNMAIDLLNDNKDKLHEMAELLMEKETIDEKDIQSIMEK